MEKLLKLALEHAQHAEIYHLERKSTGVSFENSNLKDLESTVQCGYSLRLIKNGKMGFAYTKNLIDRKGLVDNALVSLKGGIDAPFNFPAPGQIKKVDTYNPGIEKIGSQALVDECIRLCSTISSRSKAQVNASAEYTISSLAILNSNGVNLSQKSSTCYIAPQLLYPGTHSSVYRMHLSKAFSSYPDSYLDHIICLYNDSQREATPGSGRMKVIFLPESVYTLMWRLKSASSGRSVFENESPLAKKIGQRIFSEKLTVWNDPLDDRGTGARSFDDEGTPCGRLDIVKDGTLNSFYYDLKYAGKSGSVPTGNGFKGGGMFGGGDPVVYKPSPDILHLRIGTGDLSLEQMISGVDRGIIVQSALGAHSGNIPNGDFSIGLAPGFYIENGKVTGHVKDAMIAGNIYDVLQNVSAIENDSHFAMTGRYPALLLDGVSVAARG
ncbi:MAG: TldD/PmbA family protein [Candidatus Wallbacteria bacterium]|nr:TldD/PmbA family protein [Candidatus Wallbacteria bacterium]